MDEATKIKKLKEQERAGSGGDGCGLRIVFAGLLLIAAGLYVVFNVEGKEPLPNPTPIGGQTAVVFQATPTLAPTATSTPTTTPPPTETATAVPTQTPWPTSTQIPTNTALPTHTTLPTHTPQATWTPRPTWTAEPTHTDQPTYTPYPTATATERPLLAPVAIEANPPAGDSLPSWLPWLVGSLVWLLLVALVVLAYVSHQMRPPTPVLITPEGIPVDGTYGVRLPPPAGQPVRETPSAPVLAPVTPVTPPDAPVQSAPPEKIEVSVTDANPDTDVATMTALCTAWNEIAERGEQPSLNKLCVEYFGGKNSERLAIARRAVRWGRGNGLIGNKNKNEVKPDEPENHSEPTVRDQRPRRRPVPVIGRRGGSVLN